MRFNSARQAWHDAYTLFDHTPNHPVRVDFGVKDNDWRIVSGVEAGNVQAVVARLKPLLRSWGMYAYSFRYTATDEKRIRNHIWLEFKRREDMRRYLGSRDQMVRLIMLQQLVVDQKRYNEQNGGHKHNNSQLAAMLGIERQNYDRDWAPVYEQCMRILDPLPSRALGPVAEVVSKMQELRLSELEKDTA